MLTALLAAVDHSWAGHFSPDGIQITEVLTDSRRVQPGALFVALAGTRTDGHAYLEQAVAGECAALVVEEGRVKADQLATYNCCVLVVADSHLACAQIAANLYGHPARDLTLVGITGTNGKTTVSYLAESVLKQQGMAVGVIGTVNYRYRDGQGRDVMLPAPFTTPEPLLLQSLLRRMVDAGVTHVIMEVSSHALVQHRLGDLRFDVAAFTNLTRDHLDYHLDMDDYFAAKSLLFRDHLRPGGRAVIARTPCPEPGEETRVTQLIALVEQRGGQVVQCNRVGSDIYPVDIEPGLNSTRMTLHAFSEKSRITTPLVGDFNVANLQVVLGIGVALGLGAETLAGALGLATGAPGRLQRVLSARQEESFRPAVFVDYAHTPDALEKVLVTLANLPHRKMFCVFGCGGDRDKGKRAIMGEIAGRYCDVALVTDDNPRTEPAGEIVDQIVAGIRKGREQGCGGGGLEERSLSWLQALPDAEKGFLVLHDRGEAISAAIGVATAEDIVLIAGKGHETYQQGLEGRRFFDDTLEAQKGLTGWRLESLALATRGELVGGQKQGAVSGAVVTDSRKVVAGDIFVALVGERFDGHDFLPQVVAAGAGVLVINRTALAAVPAGVACLLVDDTLRALGDLAAYRRQVMKSVSRPLVVGITGSCGKTTVKEMTASIFAEHWARVGADVAPSFDPVLKTSGNFNNLVGLPLSLLPVGPEQKTVILEMGMNRPGEIDRLARIADPDIACIVNVHAAHLEGLHSLAGVAAAKEELFAGCNDAGTLVVNLDDPHVRASAGKYRHNKVGYAAGGDGINHAPDVWASEVRKTGHANQAFVLQVRAESAPVQLSVPGIHNVSNAVAAAAIASAAGIDMGAIVAGLKSFRATDKRMQIVNGKGGLSILNDTYNANPASMRAGLVTLGQQGDGRRAAILGDMLELGTTSAEAHRDIGRCVAEQGIEYLALVGDFAEETADGAIQAGMDRQLIRIFQEKTEAARWVEELLQTSQLVAGDWLLVKGSRGMRLEAVVSLLLEEQGAHEGSPGVPDASGGCIKIHS